MHILLIPSWYKTPNNPITGTFFEEQARMLMKKGHKVGVLFHEHNLRFLGDLRYNQEIPPKDFNDNGIPTYYSSTQSFVPKIETPTKLDIAQITYTAFNKFKKYVKQYGKPDVIHAHSIIWGGVIADYISQKENIPFFLTKHFTGWITQIKRIESASYKSLISQVVANSQKTFVVSSFYKNELIEKYSLSKEKMIVIPNIVNPIFFNNRQYTILEKPVRLVITAYLVERKNHIVLFNAIKILKSKGLGLKLKVIGNGPYENTLRDYVLTYDLEKEITFAGLLNRNEIVEEIKKAHLVISSSTFETFGVNIIEGLAMGKPCVVLNSGGPEDIMRSEDGIMFSENSPQAFARAIEDVITNYSNFNQDEIANSCINRFGEDFVYSKLIKYYEESNQIVLTP